MYIDSSFLDVGAFDELFDLDLSGGFSMLSTSAITFFYDAYSTIFHLLHAVECLAHALAPMLDMLLHVMYPLRLVFLSITALWIVSGLFLHSEKINHHHVEESAIMVMTLACAIIGIFLPVVSLVGCLFYIGYSNITSMGSLLKTAFQFLQLQEESVWGDVQKLELLIQQRKITEKLLDTTVTLTLGVISFVAIGLCFTPTTLPIGLALLAVASGVLCAHRIAMKTLIPCLIREFKPEPNKIYYPVGMFKPAKFKIHDSADVIEITHKSTARALLAAKTA